MVSAANDAQVPGSDADAIFAALGSDAKDKVRVTIADANHVYKSETRPPSTIGKPRSSPAMPTMATPLPTASSMPS